MEIKKSEKIKISEIQDKNINFLFGSGASSGILPTLSLKIKDNNIAQSIETLATKFEKEKEEDLYALLFMHYYKECIEPAMLLNQDDIDDNDQKKVFKNYETFLDTLLQILLRRNEHTKKCNIFTTNYDGCFTFAAESLLQKNRFDFVMNDGSHGFKKRVLNSRNFNKKTMYTGIFDQYEQEIAQINLIHLHGSVYWYENDNCIEIDYNLERNISRTFENIATNLEAFSDDLMDSKKDISDLNHKLDDNGREEFWKEYKTLPIVNPTKWKFHETVFEEHYYQMLRYLSYELEKPNSVLIVFGFSFKDEHIRNLLKRSLSNPQLHLFICCRDPESRKEFEEMFQDYSNVEYIVADKEIDFLYFNNNIFTLSSGQKDSHEDKGTSE